MRRRLRTPRHKRPALVASFVVLLVVTSVAFATTGVGYFATEKVKGDVVTGTVIDYRVDETADPVEIVVEVEVENPTSRAVTIDSASLNGVVDGSTAFKGSTVVGETIPAGGSETVTIRMTPIIEDPSAAITAAENGSMTFAGTAWARIERSRFQTTISGGGEQS